MTPNSPARVLLVAAGLALLASTTARAQFTPVERIRPPQPAPFDGFGSGVAVRGDRVLVTAPADDDIAPEAGLAFLYDAATGTLVRTLGEPGLVGSDRYGDACAMGPAAAIVSAWGGGSGGGAIYLYDPGTGNLLDAYAPVGLGSGDRFGFSLDTDGDLAIAGAPNADGVSPATGAAILLDVGVPRAVAQLGRLGAVDGSQGAGFGFAVALHGGYALVGAPRESALAPSAGAAYLFDVSDPLRPAQVARLTASDAEPFDFFGKSVALHGTVAVVGAPDADQPEVSGAGAAYIFDISDPANPQEVAVLGEPDAGVLGNFGLSVATDGAAVLVGAPNHDGGAPNSGIVYVYDAATGAATGAIAADAPSFAAGFGTSLDLTGRDLAVGAPQAEVAGDRAGSAYLYAAACRADLDGDGEPTIFDFLAFQNLFDAGDPAADFDGDGSLTLFDFLAFQNAFDAGC
ncbi:MAG: GC-type dockerin domain-anchored protein [Phycisphaerales bacterium]